jgi:hypothetical protein
MLLQIIIIFWCDYYRNSTFKKVIYPLYKLDKKTLFITKIIFKSLFNVFHIKFLINS